MVRLLKLHETWEADDTLVADEDARVDSISLPEFGVTLDDREEVDLGDVGRAPLEEHREVGHIHLEPTGAATHSEVDDSLLDLDILGGAVDDIEEHRQSTVDASAESAADPETNRVDGVAVHIYKAENYGDDDSYCHQYAQEGDAVIVLCRLWLSGIFAKTSRAGLGDLIAGLAGEEARRLGGILSQGAVGPCGGETVEW